MVQIIGVALASEPLDWKTTAFIYL